MKGYAAAFLAGAIVTGGITKGCEEETAMEAPQPQTIIISVPQQADPHAMERLARENGYLEGALGECAANRAALYLLLLNNCGEPENTAPLAPEETPAPPGDMDLKKLIERSKSIEI